MKALTTFLSICLVVVILSAFVADIVYLSVFISKI